MSSPHQQRQCLVCLENFEDGANRAIIQLTCCQRYPSSSNILCAPCAHLLVEHSSIRGFGRCPLCSVFFKIIGTPGGDEECLEVCRGAGDCRCCLQVRLLVDGARCSACLLGQRFPLVYNCVQCGCAQRIPHPMWRYLETPTSVTSDTWACHRCGEQSRWRLHPDAVPMVPLDDAPLSWGAHDTWLAQVRTHHHHRGAHQLPRATDVKYPWWEFALFLVAVLYYAYFA